MFIDLNKLLKLGFKGSHFQQHTIRLFLSTCPRFPPGQTVPVSFDDTIHHVSSLINQPKWEESKHLKLIVSHIPPLVASRIIAQQKDNIELGFRFFRWVCKQSSYCYHLEGRINLLQLMKAVIFLIKECSGDDEIEKLMGALDDMRETGFRLNYPCYSTLLMCLAKFGMGPLAFRVSRRMARDGFVLGLIDYRSIINALCKNGLIQPAEMFLSRILRSGFTLDVHIYTSLVGWMQSQQVTFSVLIHGLCEAFQIEEAFRMKQEMIDKGCLPSTRTYTILIKALCDIGSMDEALGLLNEMVIKACKPNNHTYTVLIAMLCAEGRIEEANGMFRAMLKDGLLPGTVTYNALINGYCKEGKVESAFELLSVMERRNCKPNIRTYNELMEALLLLRRLLDNGLLPDRVSYNILIDGFCREGQLRMAFNILNSMERLDLEPDGVTYTTLIDGLCKQGRLDQANGILGLMMKRGISPDEVTWTALIDGYCKIGKMVDHSCPRSPHAFNSFLDVLSKQLRMVKSGLVPSVVTYTTLIDGLCRAELMKQVGSLPNVYTYTVVIHSLCQQGRMSLLGLSPNYITYSILVNSHILSTMVRNGCQPNSCIYHSLLTGFVMQGRELNPEPMRSPSDIGGADLTMRENGEAYDFNHALREMDIGSAFELLDKIKKCGGSSMDVYNILVMGLCKVGRMSEVGHLVKDMASHGLFPDKTVCSVIIEHFGKEHKFDYCLEFIKLIVNERIIPSITSYCSVILGLRKEGKVEEAQRLVSDLFKFTDIGKKAAVSPYIEFLVKEDQPHEFIELIKEVEQTYRCDRPII
ncbi:hypothetical protein NMG60_11019124 [Bertholletia excelsa]